MSLIPLMLFSLSKKLITSEYLSSVLMFSKTLFNKSITDKTDKSFLIALLSTLPIKFKEEEI